MEFQQNTAYVPVYGAALDRATKFVELFEDAAALNARTPVFSTAVDPERFRIATVGTSASGFRIATVEKMGCSVLALCAQVGRAQFVWLADPADPEFWATIDEAKTTGELGLAFLSPDEAWFQTMGIPSDRAAFEKLRGRKANGQTPFSYVAMMMMHANGLKDHFAGVLPNVEITYRRTCLLLTSAVTAAIESTPGAVIERAAPLSTGD
ncbi:hypothetical protein [Paraburkholderia caledonica]|uniref:hypothetical protein n=1 Tax=Paraburkholderia caledonica TaxID=134536 RepID=UPI000B3FC05A|nr:hypothetical protein [Paraburkholderia caledonica]